jgi:hypothetical protein
LFFSFFFSFFFFFSFSFSLKHTPTHSLPQELRGEIARLREDCRHLTNNLSLANKEQSARQADATGELQRREGRFVAEIESLKDKLRWYTENQELIEAGEDERAELRGVIELFRRELRRVKVQAVERKALAPTTAAGPANGAASPQKLVTIKGGRALELPDEFLLRPEVEAALVKPYAFASSMSPAKVREFFSLLCFSFLICTCLFPFSGPESILILTLTLTLTLTLKLTLQQMREQIRAQLEKELAVTGTKDWPSTPADKDNKDKSGFSSASTLGRGARRPGALPTHGSPTDGVRTRRDPTDLRRIKELEAALQDAHEVLRKRNPNSVLTLVHAAAQEQAQKKEQELQRELTEAARAQDELRAEHGRRLRGYRQVCIPLSTVIDCDQIKCSFACLLPNPNPDPDPNPLVELYPGIVTLAYSSYIVFSVHSLVFSSCAHYASLSLIKHSLLRIHMTTAGARETEAAVRRPCGAAGGAGEEEHRAGALQARQPAAS